MSNAPALRSTSIRQSITAPFFGISIEIRSTALKIDVACTGWLAGAFKSILSMFDIEVYSQRRYFSLHNILF
jgi:hypothetical protein